jgi:hypothetical protein
MLWIPAGIFFIIEQSQNAFEELRAAALKGHCDIVFYLIFIFYAFMCPALEETSKEADFDDDEEKSTKVSAPLPEGGIRKKPADRCVLS